MSKATDSVTHLSFTLDAAPAGLRDLVGSMVHRTLDAEATALEDLKRVLVD